MNTNPDSIHPPQGSIDDHKLNNTRDSLQQLEHELWNNAIDDQAVDNYQRAFRDYEAMRSQNGQADDRAHFIITIPVADRPRQLQNCLQSILRLCEYYMYGGSLNGVYNKISVVIADDSADEENIARNKSLCEQFSSKGLDTRYFGIDEQIRLVDSLPDDKKIALAPALGDIIGDLKKSTFSHKGASVMRNITYLHLRDLCREHDNPLIYFIDSDQDFCINIEIDNDEKHIYAINYFHHLNEIFSDTDTEVVTGKVVGDPPVSPSVMAARFLDDVIAFLAQVAETSPEDHCSFHGTAERSDDAAYHDMSELFGFKTGKHTHDYQCSLTGKHSNADCLNDFSGKLNNFFHGEHPTRSTFFNYAGSLSKTAPARTVYTGNYIFRPKNLDTFIAFADLRLRMAGPTLGRLLRAGIGDKFVSANLPMLHTRTVSDSGRSEFRPDVNQHSKQVDLSGEFERQYYGDILLFTVDELTRQGYPEIIDDDLSHQTLETVEKRIHEQYLEKHAHILKQVELLTSTLGQSDNWWNRTDFDKSAIEDINVFIKNMIDNFGDTSPAFTAINDPAKKAAWLDRLHASITGYDTGLQHWKRLFQ